MKNLQIESVLAQLEHVRRTPRGWMARCPAHADRTPSLSVRDTGSRILLNCFAGCSYDEICRSLGIGPLELDAGLTASSRGQKIAKLSRLCHKSEVSILQSDFGVSKSVAESMVRQRLRRIGLPEVRRFLRANRGRDINLFDYFTIEVGLDSDTTSDLIRRRSK
jgi:hypothetical protein